MTETNQKPKLGRPRKYKTPEELQVAIDKYFTKGISLKKVIIGPPNRREIQEIAIPSICELALWLGFINRQSLRDYCEQNIDTEDRQFTCIIKKAISQIEGWNEVNSIAANSAGSIFWLKCHSWRESPQMIEITGLPPVVVQLQGSPESGIKDT